MNNLRVLLIDDHTLFRVGLEGLLASRGIEIVASVSSGWDAQRLVDELNPDIILLDMRMPGINGLDVLSMLRKKNESLPIVMLTTSTDENDLLKSLRSGAQGYLLKDMEPDELVLALRDIVAGKTVVAPDLAPILAKAVQGKTTGPQPPPSTADDPEAPRSGSPSPTPRIPPRK